ncbi:integrase, catalytic region, zinc finger, CCHC-type containing protein [Tanacetum coccineum]
MSSPNHSTSDIEDFSMNILNYTSVSSDSFPASLGSNSFNSSENSNEKYYSTVFVTPSLLFNPRYFFIPEKLLPPKKRICSPSSSSTTLSNSSRNQTCDLVSPSSLVYTPTPPQIFKIGKCPIKMYLKHHEGQIEDILNYLDELYLYHIKKMEEGRIDRMIIRRNSNEIKTELKKIRTQIIRLQKERMPPKRTSTSETPAITLDAIRQLIADFTAALEAQTTAIASASNPNRNTRPREIPVAKRGNYKEFINCQPFYFNGTEGAVDLILNQQSEFSQLDSGLTIPVFKHGDDPIDAINHVMSFLSAVVTSRYPTTNNQLRNSSNPRRQATINDGRVTVQPVQGRQISYATSTTRTFTPGASGSNSEKQRIITYYNCKGEGHMSKQCTKPRRKRDDSWFKEKVLLVQAQANGQILHEEELVFLAYPGIPEAQATQMVITHNAAY